MLLRLGTIFAFMSLVACSLFGPPLRSESKQVLGLLGRITDFHGENCPDSKQIVEIYLDEMGNNQTVSIVKTLPRFAARAAKLCPESRPQFGVANQVDAKSLAPILGKSAVDVAGPIKLEPWLSLKVEEGKVTGLSTDLSAI